MKTIAGTLALAVRRLTIGAVLSGCVLASIPAQAEVSALEQSLLDKRYSDFQRDAKLAAKGGNAEALFLLGKSHDLGLGVEKNRALGRSYYEQAEALGSIRATHNLGVIALEEGDKVGAIRRFQKALDGGMKMPTLRNLGRAYEPDEKVNIESTPALVAGAEKSAGYYAQAFEASRDAELAARAGRQYLLAYNWARRGQVYGILKEKDLPKARQRAVEWLSKGMDLGAASAWTNYGALLYSEGKDKEARDAFEHGAKADLAVAHQYLGQLDERDGPDATQSALGHYERALALGHAPARDDIMRLLTASLRCQTNPEALGRGIKRLEELHQEGDDTFQLSELIERYNWRSLLATEKQRGRRLPDLPLYLKACQLREKFDPQRIQDFRYWTLNMQGTENDDPFEVRGELDRAGCAQIPDPLPGAVRNLLNSGGVMYLRFPTGTLLLDWQVKGKQIHLVPRPLKEQMDVPLS